MRICFLSLPSYPTLTGENLGYAGGAEVEQVELGKELSLRGFNITFVTYRQGVNSVKVISGIKIIETYSRERANVISAAQKYSSVFSALKSAKADIYFHESGAVGVLPIFSFLNRSKSVYRIPSDTVVLLQSISGNMSLKMTLAQLMEFKGADIILAQSIFQKSLLHKKFGLNSHVIKNGIYLPATVSKKSIPPTVLWVGSMSGIKQPLLFLELAKSLPFVQFEMIGGRGTPPELYDKTVLLAKKLPNLTFHGFIPYAHVNEYFAKASIFVNTSIMEGFPNTFIQAWANFVPVLSMRVDPDGLIRNRNLGLVSGSFSQLVSDISMMLANESLRRNIGQRCRSYVESEHDIRNIVENYITVFENLRG